MLCATWNVRGFSEVVCCIAPKLRILMPSVPGPSPFGLRLPVRWLFIFLLLFSVPPYCLFISIARCLYLILDIILLYLDYLLFVVRFKYLFLNLATMPSCLAICACADYPSCASYLLHHFFNNLCFSIIIQSRGIFLTVSTTKCPPARSGTLKCL